MQEDQSLAAHHPTIDEDVMGPCRGIIEAGKPEILAKWLQEHRAVIDVNALLWHALENNSWDCIGVLLQQEACVLAHQVNAANAKIAIATIWMLVQKQRTALLKALRACFAPEAWRAVWDMAPASLREVCVNERLKQIKQKMFLEVGSDDAKAESSDGVVLLEKDIKEIADKIIADCFMVESQSDAFLLFIQSSLRDAPNDLPHIKSCIELMLEDFSACFSDERIKRLSDYKKWIALYIKLEFAKKNVSFKEYKKQFTLDEWRLLWKLMPHSISASLIDKRRVEIKENLSSADEMKQECYVADSSLDQQVIDEVRHCLKGNDPLLHLIRQRINERTGSHDVRIYIELALHDFSDQLSEDNFQKLSHYAAWLSLNAKRKKLDEEIAKASHELKAHPRYKRYESVVEHINKRNSLPKADINQNEICLNELDAAIRYMSMQGGQILELHKDRAQLANKMDSHAEELAESGSNFFSHRGRGRSEEENQKPSPIKIKLLKDKEIEDVFIFYNPITEEFSPHSSLLSLAGTQREREKAWRSAMGTKNKAQITASDAAYRKAVTATTFVKSMRADAWDAEQPANARENKNAAVEEKRVESNGSLASVEFLQDQSALLHRLNQYSAARIGWISPLSLHTLTDGFFDTAHQAQDRETLYRCTDLGFKLLKVTVKSFMKRGGSLYNSKGKLDCVQEALRFDDVRLIHDVVGIAPYASYTRAKGDQRISVIVSTSPPPLDEQEKKFKFFKRAHKNKKGAALIAACRADKNLELDSDAECVEFVQKAKIGLKRIADKNKQAQQSIAERIESAITAGLDVLVLSDADCVEGNYSPKRIGEYYAEAIVNQNAEEKFKAILFDVSPNNHAQFEAAFNKTYSALKKQKVKKRRESVAVPSAAVASASPAVVDPAPQGVGDSGPEAVVPMRRPSSPSVFDEMARAAQPAVVAFPNAANQAEGEEDVVVGSVSEAVEVGAAL